MPRIDHKARHRLTIATAGVSNNGVAGPKRIQGLSADGMEVTAAGWDLSRENARMRACGMAQKRAHHVPCSAAQQPKLV
jgi:hypothetical protein